MRRAASFVTALFVAPILSLAAQTPMSAEVGLRVRLKTDAGSRWLTGTLVGDNGDSLRLQVDDHASPILIARQTVSRFEVSYGRHSHTGTGALIGFGVGALSGAVYVAKDAFDYPGAAAVLGGALFGGAGALLGAVIGAVSHSDDWEAKSVGRARATLVPRGAGLALSLTF